MALSNLNSQDLASVGEKTEKTLVIVYIQPRKLRVNSQYHFLLSTGAFTVDLHPTGTNRNPFDLTVTPVEATQTAPALTFSTGRGRQWATRRISGWAGGKHSLGFQNGFLEGKVDVSKKFSHILLSFA